VIKQQRLALGLTQKDVAELLTVTQAQVSRLENGSRMIGSVVERRRIARLLHLAPEDLEVVRVATGAIGVEEGFMESHLDLAEMARESGRSADALRAANEVLAHVPVRAATESLARIRARSLAVGAIALGDPVDIRATARPIRRLEAAHDLARELHQAHGLARLIAVKLGNEYRKGGSPVDGVRRLEVARGSAPSAGERALAEIGLVRALSAARRHAEAVSVASDLARIEDAPDEWTPTVHPCIATEVMARAALQRGRFADAKRISGDLVAHRTVAPQWHIIIMATRAEALMSNGQDDAAFTELLAAFRDARRLGLPQLVQRTLALLRANRAPGAADGLAQLLESA
jgi:transcriptional regulator with XRE-family HTH domain